AKKTTTKNQPPDIDLITQNTRGGVQQLQAKVYT
ncbi:hypothetical protein Pgy4_42029, partial [Pseudomonas savastanoi pv. glycinea str. race 4]